MLTIDQLKAELRYDPATGVLTRVRNSKTVFVEGGRNYPRIELLGKRINAYKAVLALSYGRYPEKNEFRHVGSNPLDLRLSTFKLRRRDGRKDCAGCGRDLPLERYHHNPQRNDKRGSYCMDCAKVRSKRYGRNTVLRKYALTHEAYAAMLTAQDGVCRICRTPPRAKHLAVDHCHKTGAIRGLLCGSCNTSIGKLKDDPKLLLRAAQYLLGKLPD